MGLNGADELSLPIVVQHGNFAGCFDQQPHAIAKGCGCYAACSYGWCKPPSRAREENAIPSCGTKSATRYLLPQSQMRTVFVASCTWMEYEPLVRHTYLPDCDRFHCPDNGLVRLRAAHPPDHQFATGTAVSSTGVIRQNYDRVPSTPGSHPKTAQFKSGKIPWRLRKKAIQTTARAE